MQRPGETWEGLLLHSETFQNFQKNDSTEVRLRVGAEVANMQTETPAGAAFTSTESRLETIMHIHHWLNGLSINERLTSASNHRLRCGFASGRFQLQAELAQHHCSMEVVSKTEGGGGGSHPGVLSPDQAEEDRAGEQARLTIKQKETLLVQSRSTDSCC